MFNEKQKKLVLECIEHFQDWENHMDRFNEPKQKQLLFGETITVYEPTTKMVELNKIRALLKPKLPIDELEECKKENELNYYGRRA
tara:strand:+ start:43 stop:300 length:258 start_codon:yes stop_codon:yes gene_type:complete